MAHTKAGHKVHVHVPSILPAIWCYVQNDSISIMEDLQLQGQRFFSLPNVLNFNTHGLNDLEMHKQAKINDKNQRKLVVFNIYI